MQDFAAIMYNSSWALLWQHVPCDFTLLFTVQELLGQSGHYSPKVRLEALQGLQELFKEHPGELRRQVIIPCPRMET